MLRNAPKTPFHPSLRFKCINKPENLWSVRVTVKHRMARHKQSPDLLDCESRWLYEINFNERDFILFISQNLKSRLGDMSIYNFEFLKTFMEAKQDYHAKKLLEAIMGVE